jgi:cation transport regulator
MPYDQLSDLPDNVRKHLPEHAQVIYKEAFNHAWNEYADREDRREGTSREETAHKIAWSAVKQNYQKDLQSGKWIRKSAALS